MESTEDIASLLLALHDSTPRTHPPVSTQPTVPSTELTSLPLQPEQPVPPPGAILPEQIKPEPIPQPQLQVSASRSPGHLPSSSLGPASSPGDHPPSNLSQSLTEINPTFDVRAKSPPTTLPILPPFPVTQPAIPSPPVSVPSTSTSTTIIPTPDTDTKPAALSKAPSPSAPLGASSSSSAAATAAAAATTPTARGTKRKRGTGSKAEIKAKSKLATVAAELPKANPQSAAHVLHPDAGIIRCICGIIDDDGFTIQCDRCYAWEHAVCMGIQEGNVPDEYLCELCLPRVIDFQGAKEKQRAKKEELILRTEIEAARALPHQRKTSGPVGTTSSIGEKGSHHAGHSKNKKSNHLIREVLHPPSKDSQPLSIDTSSLSNSASAANGHSAISSGTSLESQTPTSSQNLPTGQRASSNLHISLSSIQQQSLTNTNPPSPHPGLTNSAVVTQDEDEKFEPWTMEYFPVRENVVRDPIVRKKLESLQTVWDRRLGGLVSLSPLSTHSKQDSASDLSNDKESPTREQDETLESDEEMKDRSSPSAPTTSTVNQMTKSPVLKPIKVPPEYEPSFSTLGDFLPPVLLAAPTLASVSSKYQVKPLPANAPSNPPQQSFTLSHPSITTSLLRPVYTRPSAYAVFAEGAIPQGTLVGELNGELFQGEKYRQDPINQYRFLGCPKPGVRTLGPGVDLVLDSRGFGNQLRFIRSSCHPNCVLRPMLFFRHHGSANQDTPIAAADSSPSEYNPPLASSGLASELLFGVFATKDISKREEITLPWEWDDGHVVHALQKLLDSKFTGPFHHSLFNSSSAAAASADAQDHRTPTPLSGSRRNSLYPVDDIPSLSELVPKLSTVLIHLTGTFATCACLKKKDCVLSQMARLVEGKPFWGLVEKTVGQGRGGRRPKRPDLGPLIGPVRGWRNRELKRWVEREKLIEAQTLVDFEAPHDLEEAEVVNVRSQLDQNAGGMEGVVETDTELKDKETRRESEIEVEVESVVDMRSQHSSPKLARRSSSIKPVSQLSVENEEVEDKMDVDESTNQEQAQEPGLEAPKPTVSAPTNLSPKITNTSPVTRPPNSTSSHSDSGPSKRPLSEPSQRFSSPAKSFRRLPSSSPVATKFRRLPPDTELTADDDAGNFSDASTLTEPLSNYDSDSASDEADTSSSSIAASDSEEDDGDDDSEEDEEEEEVARSQKTRSTIPHTPKAAMYSSDELSSPGPPSSPTSSPPPPPLPMTPLKSAPVGRRRFPTRVESESPPSSPPDTFQKKTGETRRSDVVSDAQKRKEKSEDDPMSSHLSLPSDASENVQPTMTATSMPFPPSPPPPHLDPWIPLSLAEDVSQSNEKDIPTGPRSLKSQSYLASTKEPTPPLPPPSPSPPPKEPTPPPPKPPTPPPVKRMSLKDWSKRKKAAAPVPAVEKMVIADENSRNLYQSYSPEKSSETISTSQLPVPASSLDTPDDLIYPPSSPDDENVVAVNARIGAVKDASQPPTPSSEDEPIPGFTPRQTKVQQSNLSSKSVEASREPSLAANESLPDSWRHRKEETSDAIFTEPRSITPPPSMSLSSSPRTLQMHRSSMTHMSDPYVRSPSPMGMASPSTTPPLPHRQLSSSVKSSEPPKGPALNAFRNTGALPVRRPESNIPTGPHKSLPPLPPSLPAKPIAVRSTHSPTRPRFVGTDRDESPHHAERDRELEERERERERERDSERDLIREQRPPLPLKESPVSSTVPLVRPPFHSSHVRPFGPGAFRGRGALAGVPSGPRTTWTPPRGPRGMGGPFRGGGMGGRGMSSMPATGMAPRAPRMMVPPGEDRERLDDRLPPPTRMEGRDISESPRGAFRGRGGMFRGRAR